MNAAKAFEFISSMMYLTRILMTQLDEDELHGKEEGKKESSEVVRYRCRKERQLSLEVIAQIIKR
jgi:hypothetical protein